jgi:pimeloyl-ACP methyl ester carboxylesterase
MSTTGNPDLPQPQPDVLRLLMQTPPTERQAAIEHGLRVWRALHGPAFEFDEVRIREIVELSYDRDPDPLGTARQLLAIVTAASRKDALGSLAIPTLVIHGDADPLVPIAAGYDTAEAVPGARMSSSRAWVELRHLGLWWRRRRTGAPLCSIAGSGGPSTTPTMEANFHTPSTCQRSRHRITSA